MKNKIVILSLIASIVCLFSAACTKKEEIAAKVGNRTITVTELQTSYDNSKDYAVSSGYDISTEEGRHAFLDYLIDSIAIDEVVVQEAEKIGLGMTEEEIAEANSYAEEQYKAMYQQYLDAYSQYTDGEAMAKKQFAANLASSGLSIEGLKKTIFDQRKKEILEKRFKEEITKTFELSSEQLKKKYEEELATQKNFIEQDPSYYFIYDSYYDKGYTFMPLIVPEGFFYVKHILVEDEATAKEVLEKVKAGENFEDLMKQYNMDSGMDAYPKGYVCGEGAQFVEEFLNAALALKKEGDVSDIVKSEYGYHIIKRYGEVPSRIVAYEAITNAFNERANTYYKTEQYDKYEEELAKEKTEKYTEMYYDIGA